MIIYYLKFELIVHNNIKIVYKNIMIGYMCKFCGYKK